MLDNLYQLLTGNADPISFTKLIITMLPMFMLFADTPPPPASPPPVPPPTPPPVAGDKFYSGFSEDLKNHPSIIKFENSEALGKSYVELERKIGAKGVLIPGENAGQEEIDTFHKALGRPDLKEGYGEFPTIEGAEDERLGITKERLDDFKDIAFKLGLSTKQVVALHDWNTKRGIANLKAFDDNSTKERETSETELRREWGNKFDSNVALANKIAKTFGDDKFMDYISKGEGNNPNLIKLLANIGSKLSEDALGELGKGGATQFTPAQATIEIQKIRDDKSHAYNDGNHRDHKVAVAYMQSLYKMENPGQK